MNNIDVVKGLYQAFAKGDIQSVLAALNPNVEWTEAEGFPSGGTYRGPEAVLKNVFIVGAEPVCRPRLITSVRGRHTGSAPTLICKPLYFQEYKLG